jgi:hypothetical protein
MGQTLSLRDTKLTDAALEELGHLEQLRFLDLRGSRVTDARLEEFGVAHPKVAINGKPSLEPPFEFENLAKLPPIPVRPQININPVQRWLEHIPPF